LGPSGAGKSDLALRLHAVGADLIVDDLLTLSAHNGVIHAHAPARQPALLHVRGIGMLALPAHGPIAARTPVALALHLCAAPGDGSVAQISWPGHGALPLVLLNPFEISACIKVRLALARWGL
ncbi:MAG: aldolase, partial [Sphingopyxis sp.]